METCFAHSKPDPEIAISPYLVLSLIVIFNLILTSRFFKSKPDLEESETTSDFVIVA